MGKGRKHPVPIYKMAKPRSGMGGTPDEMGTGLVTTALRRRPKPIAYKAVPTVTAERPLLGLKAVVHQFEIGASFHLDGVDAPRRHRCAKVVLSNHQRRRPWARL